MNADKLLMMVFLVLFISFFSVIIYLEAYPDLTYDKTCLKKYTDSYCKKLEYFDSRLDDSYKKFDCIRPLNEDLKRTNNELKDINLLDNELNNCKKHVTN